MPSSSIVSVVIPTFERSALLPRALASVEGQTCPAGEVIVVDDGSTDGTGELVRRRFPGARVLRRENGGVSAARNPASRRRGASGSPCWTRTTPGGREKLERQLAALAAAPEHRVCHTDEIWIRDGRRVNPGRRHAKRGGRIFRHCLPLCAISPSAALIHRSLFAEVGALRRGACRPARTTISGCGSRPATRCCWWTSRWWRSTAGTPTSCRAPCRGWIDTASGRWSRSSRRTVWRPTTTPRPRRCWRQVPHLGRRRGDPGPSRGGGALPASWLATGVPARREKAAPLDPLRRGAAGRGPAADPAIRAGARRGGGATGLAGRRSCRWWSPASAGAAAAPRPPPSPGRRGAAGPAGEAAWLNVGIGGHRTLPLGEIVLAQPGDADAAADQIWCPSLVFEPPCATATVTTVDRPETGYPEDTVYEMEAAGFCAAAARFASAELIQVVKVISDNAAAPPERLTAGRVEELIAAVSTPSPPSPPRPRRSPASARSAALRPGADELGERWRFLCRFCGHELRRQVPGSRLFSSAVDPASVAGQLDVAAAGHRLARRAAARPRPRPPSRRTSGRAPGRRAAARSRASRPSDGSVSRQRDG